VTGQASSRTARHLPVYDKLPVAHKFLVATLAVLLLLGLGVTLVLQRVLRSELAEELTVSTRMMATAAAARVAPAVQAGDRGELTQIATELRAVDESVVYVLVVGRDAEVLAHTFDWDPPAEVTTRTLDAGLALGDLPARRIRIEGESLLDVAVPLMADGNGVGWIQVGIDTSRVDRFVHRTNVTVIGVLALMTLLGMVVARTLVRHITDPVVDLTHLADEVSVGKLDVRFDFGRPVRCWEIKRCEKRECAAYGNTTVQCWFVDGTPCEGYEPRFPQKLVGCRTCEVYRHHKGDEIVQLADSFRHMTHELSSSQLDLEHANRFQRGLIRNSFDGIIATDETETVQIFNRVAQQLTGYEPTEVIGRMTWDELFATHMCEALESPLFRDGESVIFGFYRREMALHSSDGGTVNVLASGITLLEEQHETGKVFFFKDMREITGLREELVRSERLAATGQTVASISHSIKNILEGLRGGAYIYNRGVRVEDPSARREGWEMVERNIDHISELVADLLNYARDRQPERQPMDPNELIEDVLRAMAGKAEAVGTVLESQPDPDAVPSELDAHSMHQCLTNLVNNAIDATSARDGGRVVASTRVSGGTLEIRVRDNGPGVAPHLVETLFSSMITTKGSKGSGLGLLVVRKIAAEHGGSVELEHTSGKGTTFCVTVPRGR
jgi:PAS domain S-box-containing protein